MVGTVCMTETPLTDAVARQYERYPYPATETVDVRDDYNVEERRRFESVLFWPAGEPRERLEILVAGCGSRQAVHCARRWPNAHVIGIDVSSTSLSRAEALKQARGVTNLDLQRLPIEGVAELGQRFDLVYATGVLHHMADPAAGLRALAGALNDGGALSCMVYGEVGRRGINLMREFFQLLGLPRDERGITLAREALQRIWPDHPIYPIARSLMAANFISDSETVDMFLHAREVSYTVCGVLDLVASARLRFQGWYDALAYNPEYHFPRDSQIYTALARLDDECRWQAMEKLVTSNWMHDFVACPMARPEASHRIDFASPHAPSFVPVLEWTFRWEALPPRYFRYNTWHELTIEQARILGEIDSQRSIEEIAAAAGVTKDYALTFIWSLGRIGCATVRI